jgi:DNA-binding response OmpR family regulator
MHMPPYRILIVEDQREVSRLLRSTLETLEAELDVVEIPSGEEAILHSSQQEVDLLIADYRLPGMSGIELMGKVQTNHPKAKIILITGQTDPKIRMDVTEAGADAFFIKPIPMAEFLDAVERTLDLVQREIPSEDVSPVAAALDTGDTQPGLPELANGLWQELAAIAVIVLDNTGKILARAGYPTDAKREAILLSYLLSIHSTGKQVSRLIGQKNLSNWFILDGGKYDLVFAPVGMTNAMLTIGKGIAGKDHILRTIDLFSTAQIKIENELGTKTSVTSVSKRQQSTSQEEMETDKKESELLFKDSKKKEISPEVNEFWNNAIEKHKAPVKPDMLTYDQAKQLGLAPKDES